MALPRWSTGKSDSSHEANPLRSISGSSDLFGILIMTDRVPLDRKSFEMLISSASAFQQSGLDYRSLSALLEIQRLVAAGNMDVDQILGLIAERARALEDATGVAIARLQGHHLLYLAGTGTATARVGHHVPAVFSAPRQHKGQYEILRVDNAACDKRIEAAVCRQLGATSVVILPILRDETLIAVLEVLFDTPHMFTDRELRTYRLMARQIADLIDKDLQCAQQEQRHSSSVNNESEMVVVPGARIDVGKNYRRNERATEISPQGSIGRETPSFWQRLAAELHKRFKLSARVVVTYGSNVRIMGGAGAVLLAVMFWIGQRQSFAPRSSAQPEGDTHILAATRNRSTTAVANPIQPLNSGMPVDGAGTIKTTPKFGFQRVQVGTNEIDCVADDVTIRQFLPSKKPTALATREVEVGDDVTIRYLIYSPAAAPKAAQSKRSSTP